MSSSPPPTNPGFRGYPIDGALAARSLTRRSLLALVPILGLAGCSEWQASNDPYIPTMKRDPMFSWRPPGNLRREYSYSPSGSGLEPSDQSIISVTHSLSGAGDVASLISAARQVMDQYGYVNSQRQIDPKYGILCAVGEVSNGRGIIVTLVAPYWK
jgi:hypothetical protein